MSDVTIVWGGILVAAHDRPAIPEGAVAVLGERVQAVGLFREISKQYPNAKIIGGSRFLLIPGLINGHSHGRGLSSFQRGALDGRLESWIWETRKFIPLPVYEDVAYSAVRLLRSGVTATMHNHLFSRAIPYEEEIQQAIRAYEDTGLRVLFCPAIGNRNPFVYGNNEGFLTSLPRSLQELLTSSPRQSALNPEDYVKVVKDLHTDHRTSMCHIGFGPLGPQWCTRDLLCQIKKEAEDSGIRIFIHALETSLQKTFGLQDLGKTLVRFMFDMGLLGPNLVIGHCVWPSQEDLQLLAGTCTGVTHHPSSNLRLQSGIAPVSAMLQTGIRVGLGLDGQGINDNDDFIQEMKLCFLLHRLSSLELDSYYPSSREIFRMATEDNAVLLGYGQELGRLEPCRFADLVLLDFGEMRYPFIYEAQDPIDVLFYRGKGSHVHTVMVNGKVIVEGGKVLNVDEEALAMCLAEAASRPRTRKEDVLVAALEELKRHIASYYKGWSDRVAHRPYYSINSRIGGLI